MGKKSAAPVIDLKRVKVACRHCSLYQLCLPMGISPEDLSRLEAIIDRRTLAKRGEVLFRIGDPFHALYAVKSGAVKTSVYTADGQEQVTGFHLAGELFGLDAIGNGAHACQAVALERTTLCEIPFDELRRLGTQLPSLCDQLMRVMSLEIQEDHASLQLAHLGAEGRLASFLLNLGERLERRGFSGSAFRLSMSRYDIANYLGLAVETVSRIFTRFQDAGLLAVRQREVHLLDPAALRARTADGLPR